MSIVSDHALLLECAYGTFLLDRQGTGQFQLWGAPVVLSPLHEVSPLTLERLEVTVRPRAIEHPHPIKTGTATMSGLRCDDIRLSDVPYDHAGAPQFFSVSVWQDTLNTVLCRRYTADAIMSDCRGRYLNIRSVEVSETDLYGGLQLQLRPERVLREVDDPRLYEAWQLPKKYPERLEGLMEGAA